MRFMFVGVLFAAMVASAVFMVVRVVATWGGGYGSPIAVLVLTAAVLAPLSCMALITTARRGTGTLNATSLSLATCVVLLMLGVVVGLRG